MKILLAEDDPNFGPVLKDYLSINGYTVMLCQDGELALQAFNEQKFDICITDVMMPLKANAKRVPATKLNALVAMKL